MTALSITAASVAIVTGVSETGRAGATITAGDVVFPDTDGDYVLSDADDTALDEVARIALNNASDGQPLEVAKPGSTITIGATMTAGLAYYLGSAAAGSIVPYGDLGTDDRVICLGHSISTTVLAFRPFDTGVILT